MKRSHRQGALAALVLAAAVHPLVLASHEEGRAVSGTIWVANRGAHTIRAFDAGTGAELQTVPMAANSQPGDLAYANGKIYVAEEFGTPPAIAVVDAATGVILGRIPFVAGARPHHVHASPGGSFVAVGLFGTDLVAVVDTHHDLLLGPWDSNPNTTNGRIHAAVFSADGRTLYLASDATNKVIALDALTGTFLWDIDVAAVHEIATTHDDRRLYVTRRTANRLAVIDIEARTVVDLLTLGLPDTLRLSANEKLLTVGLRTMPAQIAVVDTTTLQFKLVDLSVPGDATSLAGHQWTSPSGRYTFAAFEGGVSPGVAVIDHHDGDNVVQRLAYPGRPHGVDRARR